MCKHEEKSCPRCSTAFECKVGTIMQCQCSVIQLSSEERVYVESKFEDCLCIDCLAALQNEYVFLKEKHSYK
ncbi:MAG: cysteine-rich CWC family protein [Chitinophagaceae bacterium]|nr:cysteine-rich CWC family protein [Chitinophagaceae bacterium]